MTAKSVSIYLSLVNQFRNSPSLVRAFRSGRNCHRAVTWCGRQLVHPADQPGFLAALLEHWVDHSYLREDFYKPQSGDVILDIGAHIGLFSIQLATRCRGLKILAFEPSLESYNCLQANTKAFNCANIKTHRMAVGGSRGHGVIHRGARSLDNAVELSDATETSFAVLPLADVLDLAESDRIALMKVDIEGSEREFFQTAAARLLARIDRLIVEYHDNLVPGCLDAVKRALQQTHDITISPSSVARCGLMWAARKPVTPSPKP